MSVLSHEESLKHNHASEKTQEIVEVVIEIPDSEKHKPSKKKEEAKKEEPTKETHIEEVPLDEGFPVNDIPDEDDAKDVEEAPKTRAKKSKK